MADTDRRHVRIAIAGSGFGGIGMAVRLRQEGITDFVVLERAEDLGGVWRDNTYPGCACDVESHLYSFSFAPNPGWSRRYATWSEIHAYLQACADRFGVAGHLRFGHEVTRARWLDDTQRWEITTSRGVLTADVFVVATGALSEPATPALPGIERFGGKAFHSARWDHGRDLAGRRVAVIGTGASAIQFIPQIQPKVSHLTVFQRTAPWVVPRFDRAFSRRELAWLAASPLLQRLLRGRLHVEHEMFGQVLFDVRLARLVEKLARRNLERSVQDPVLREKLTPSYTLGCKRILKSDDYLPAMSQPNVRLVTAPIREVRADSLVTARERGAPEEHEVDTIIYGTGFQVQAYPFGRRIEARDGRTLEARWRAEGGMSAHLGTSVAGFPNMFVLQGPNTGLGHTSVLIMMEAQLEHVLNALRFMAANGYASVEPRASAQAAFAAEVDEKMKGTVWTSGGCASWYLDARGRNSTLWPRSTMAFERRVRRFDPSEYLLVGNRRAYARSGRDEAMATTIGGGAHA